MLCNKPRYGTLVYCTLVATLVYEDMEEQVFRAKQKVDGLDGKGSNQGYSVYIYVKEFCWPGYVQPAYQTSSGSCVMTLATSGELHNP